MGIKTISYLRYFAGLTFFFLSLFFTQPLWAGQDDVGDNSIGHQFGGQLRLEGRLAGYDNGSFFEPVGTRTGIDGLASVRLTDKLILSEKIYFEAHYEAFLKWGDTYEKQVALQKHVPSFPSHLRPEPLNIDERRLFDLTKTIKETDDFIAWNRFDRLFLSIKPSWGDIILGRQAITWGNGLIFNPMDLFNPFAPIDTVRDYKIGDDLVSIRFNTESLGEFSLLYVPRRDVTTGDIEFNRSSVAGKLHMFPGNIEMDVMGARHYNENIIGIGVAGYLGDAAWRSDLVWSSLKPEKDKNGYVEFIANIDFSWVWLKKNMYGLIEFYHNGLGKNNYPDALVDPEVSERIDRGELFVLGKNYLSGQIQMELHPLFNVYLSMINNVQDPSGIVQSWAVLSLTQNSTLKFGGSVFYGTKGSEYGGVLIPGTHYHTNAAPGAHVQFSYYF